MDFNPLDLLASTALRDNRATQPDTSSPDLNLKQPDDADADAEEEDDDETDGDGDDGTGSRSAATNGDVMPCLGCDVEDDMVMGSVKTGKNKRTFGKSVALAADGNVLGEKKALLAEETNLSSKAAIIEQAEKYLAKVRTVDTGKEDASPERETKSLCNGGEEHSSTRVSNSEYCDGSDPSVLDPDVGLTASRGDTGCEDSVEKAADRETEHTSPQTKEAEVEHGDTDSHSCQADNLSNNTGTHCASDPVAQDQNADSDCVNPEAHTQEIASCSPAKDVSCVSDSDTKIDQDLQMAVGPCNNCDEKAASSVTPLPVLAADAESREKTHSASDQELSDISGIKESHPQTDCIGMNSPPPLPLPTSLPSPSSVACVSSVLLDHCYTACPGKPVHRPSVDTAEDSGDAFESADENASASDIEHRPRSLSVDSEYLQYGVTGTPHDLDSIPHVDKNSLMSPTPSVDSVSNDSSVSENNTIAPFYSILLPGCQNQSLYSHNPPQKVAVGDGLGTMLDQASVEGSKFYNPGALDGSGCPGPAPKCGKFRIGTFASFSSSNLELDRDMPAAAEIKERRLKIGIPPEPGMKPSLSSPALISPGSPFPLLQSPGIEWDRSDAGSEIQDDLDSSTTDDKYLSSSHGSDMSGITSVVWNHPVFHDHDYCCKEASERDFGKPVAEVRPMKVGKRKYTKRKEREVDEEKINKKGKYLKRELLKQDNRFTLPGSFDSKAQSLRAPAQLDAPGTRPVGRPRKRLDRQIESDIDPETGAKMKITGKFQDQYVYYLSKTSRNRRRKLPEGGPGHPADKIILPAPKPGDIVVPHLSDADIEAIKHGGRAALKRSSSSNFPPSNLPLPQQDHVDMDSSIVNTILSMESDNLGSPMAAQAPDIADPIGLYEEQPVADGLGFMGENMNLTPDQVDLLLSVVKDVEVPSISLDSKLTTSQALDFLTSGDTVHMGSPALDSMAATTVEKDILGSAIISSSQSQGSSGVLNSDISSQVQEVGGGNVKAEIGTVIKQEPKMLPEAQRTVFNGDLPPTSMSSMPSFDKTLEFLKGDYRPDFFPESSVPQSMDSAAVPSSSENDTPWIVTVTIYWNDIPAIIISNQPYVRLVDIHKQILPAKDTGILKKRCQLMSIPVLNCTDMQRYFLVQYGRAYNSKSTLVINKDQARELIGYYVDPQPRGLRADDGSGGAGLKKSSSCVELGSYSDSSVHLHPPPFASPRRRGGFRRRVTPSHSQNPSPGPASPIPVVAEQPPLTVPTAVPDSPSKRLRHKKINFLEMLKGEDSASSSPATPSAESSRSDESLGESCSLDQGQHRVSSKATNGHKRRHSKEVSPETLTGRRNSKTGGSRERKRSTEGKTTPHKAADVRKVQSVDGADYREEADITVVVDAEADSVKVKKRSPGLSSAVSTSPPNRSKAANKYGPLKVKLKGLLNFGAAAKTKQAKKKNLFGRKASGGVSVQSSASRTLRVLKVAHQDADADVQGEEAMSQVAEVHLDLYKRRMSPCVKCWTCEKFLSVPSFLQHQHRDASSQALVSVKQLQVLVPMNKENISLEEKRLWNEFVGLQRRLDRSPLTACSMTPRQPFQPPSPLKTVVGRTVLVGGDAAQTADSAAGVADHSRTAHVAEPGRGENQVKDTSNVSVTSPAPGAIASCEFSGEMSVDVQAVPTDSGELPVGSMQTPLPFPPHTGNEEKAAGSVANNKVIPKVAPHRHYQRHRAATPTNVRTSSRKRKEKQFFSIENYSFSRKSAKLDADRRFDAGSDVTAEHIGGENGTHVVTLSNGPEIVSFTSMQDSA